MHYVQPLSWFRVNLQQLGAKQCESVHFVTGSHLPIPSYRKSRKYLKAVMELACELGFKPKLRAGQSPDADLAVLVRSREYLSTTDGSGFAKLIGQVRQQTDPSQPDIVKLREEFQSRQRRRWGRRAARRQEPQDAAKSE